MVINFQLNVLPRSITIRKFHQGVFYEMVRKTAIFEVGAVQKACQSFGLEKCGELSLYLKKSVSIHSRLDAPNFGLPVYRYTVTNTARNGVSQAKLSTERRPPLIASVQCISGTCTIGMRKRAAQIPMVTSVGPSVDAFPVFWGQRRSSGSERKRGAEQERTKLFLFALPSFCVAMRQKNPQ